MTKLGLIAGSGTLPLLFAQAAREKGHSVIAVAHRGETDPSLAQAVDHLDWVRVGQVGAILRAFQRQGVRQAAMAGGIGHVRAIAELRPDWGALRVMARIRSFRDDALLRAVAELFEESGVRIVSPTDYLEQILAPEGHICGPDLDSSQRKDLALGLEIATLLGKADVGQTVVVKNGHVLALEAVEGTDEAIRRGGTLGGPGAMVVKLCKPGQDVRFDLPAVGVRTLEVMAQVGARALAIEARRTLLLDAPALIQSAERLRISVVGVPRPS